MYQQRADELIHPTRSLEHSKNRGKEMAELAGSMKKRSIAIRDWPPAAPPPDFAFTPAQGSLSDTSVSSSSLIARPC
jgi:hypothetical protein